ncbi:unnamed protein product [Mytilus edulis]|uniref:Ketoreductase (KR) domain-containing protein n=1 Tax=Mytilus edulis TaxID=6550 RepID=A0A8S3R104_MYTED|nr:unnamed protein product [Mytilus edulis]
MCYCTNRYFKFSDERSSFDRRTKTESTWNLNLHLVSRKYPLDYFVMHSSMASVMGNIGQSNYGAVNAFMDCLAHYRKLNGLSGQSINWGPLDVGMVKDGANIEEILKQHGYFSLDVSDIRHLFPVPEEDMKIFHPRIFIFHEGSAAALFPMSFKGSSRIDLNPKHFDFAQITVDQDISLELTKFMKKRNLKLFDVVVSLYQILLSVDLKIKTVFPFGTVDMRKKIPDLKETICGFTNHVSFYTNVDHTVHLSFLGKNKRTITSAIENSLLPFDNIVEFLTNIKPEDVFRHLIIMESIKDF